MSAPRMSLNRFFDEYVPNVLRPMGGWEVLEPDDGGEPGPIRRLGPDQMYQCPLSAAVGRRASCWREGAEAIGINDGRRYALVAAADKPAGPTSAALRVRLLAALGLRERHFGGFVEVARG